jgi:hypothetical protein
LRLNVIR